MTDIGRYPAEGRAGDAPATQIPKPIFTSLLLLLFCFLCLFLVTVTDIPDNNGSSAQSGVAAVANRIPLPNRLRESIVRKRKRFSKALRKLTKGGLPVRLQRLRSENEIVGERLDLIQAGSETVEEVLHFSKGGGEAKTPLTVEEVIDYLTDWLHTLHERLQDVKKANHLDVWQAYHDLAVKTLFPWDQKYLRRMPDRREDGSIFLSVASYRDENCYNTLSWAYGNATNPANLFVGLIQQNCEQNCRSGVLVGGKMEDVEPDQDCHHDFCRDFPSLCPNVRALHIDEDESLGPYAARFFGSKLWHGEQWYMQIDAHMTFRQDWDSISIRMLNAAPTQKPVLSHYPPGHDVDLVRKSTEPGSRLCGPAFAGSELESQIIRLEGAGKYDKVKLDIPRFAPFTAAGYFVAHSDFLKDVPFDPFLPWIFMGEEIIMSTRLWTAGYDIYSPSESVVGHMYVRRHKPKFWESVNRALHPGVITPLKFMILGRIKHQLGYPEADKDMIQPKSLLTAVEQYSMGVERPLEEYLRSVGLNVTTKEITYTEWCEKGTPPPGMEEYAHLYETEKR